MQDNTSLKWDDDFLQSIRVFKSTILERFTLPQIIMTHSQKCNLYLCIPLQIFNY